MKNVNISLRKRLILGFVVDYFIETGQPIGSSHLISKYGLKFSSATIRKELNALMKLGLLSQGHISSGRYPTEKGINYYIDNILNIEDANEQSLSILENEYNRLNGTLDYVLNETSNILSDFTHLTSLATLPNRDTLKIKSSELLKMRRNEYLLILVFEGGLTERTFIKLDTRLPDNQISNLSNYLNKLTLGLTIEQLRKVVLERINKIKNEYDEFLEKVFRISCELFERERKIF